MGVESKSVVDQISNEKADLQVVLAEKEKEIVKLQECSEVKLVIQEKEEKIANLETELDAVKNYISQKEIEFKKIETASKEKAELEIILETKKKEIDTIISEK